MPFICILYIYICMKYFNWKFTRIIKSTVHICKATTILTQTLEGKTQNNEKEKEKKEDKIREH